MKWKGLLTSAGVSCALGCSLLLISIFVLKDVFAVLLLGWATLGAGMQLLVSFIRSRRKPKADPPKEIALVEWDV